MTPEHDLSSVDVVVLAGGLGTRIQPVLGDTPKLLAPIGSQTYLDLLLTWLRGFGLKRVVFSLGHLADAIVSHLEAHPPAGIEIATVIETEPLGTAGALRHVAPHVQTETSLILNGDSWTAVDLDAFVAAHRAQARPATILCVRVPDAGRYGKIDTSAEGSISGFSEKMEGAGAGLINAGIYAFGSGAWRLIEKAEGRSLERDVFAAAPAGTFNAFDAGDVSFIDIGTPESLEISQHMLPQEVRS